VLNIQLLLFLLMSLFVLLLLLLLPLLLVVVVVVITVTFLLHEGHLSRLFFDFIRFSPASHPLHHCSVPICDIAIFLTRKHVTFSFLKSWGLWFLINLGTYIY